MSLWIRCNRGPGTWHYLALEVPWALFPAAAGVGLAILLSFSPAAKLAAALAAIACGVMLMVAAKNNIAGRGRWISCGPVPMMPGRRLTYRIGWALLLAGGAIGLLGLAMALRTATVD